MCSQSSGLYLGHLLSMDTYQVLGLATNTLIKILVICHESPTSDVKYKEFILEFHALYVRCQLNPFQRNHSKVASSSLAHKIATLVDKHA